MATCCIALGGNIGNTAMVFEQALMCLQDCGIRIHRMSSILRSRAMGREAGDGFLNAAAVVESTLNPAELLRQLHRIEAELGRERHVHWGPRRIDLDLLLYDQQTIDTNTLVIPHPAMWYRRFVLEPLAQVAPDVRHPILGESVLDLRARLDHRPLRIVVPRPSNTRFEVAEIQAVIDQRFGVDTVTLTHHSEVRDVFATVRLEIRNNELHGDRTQPAHEPDRTIRVLSEPDSTRLKLIESLTDVCSAALG